MKGSTAENTREKKKGRARVARYKERPQVAASKMVLQLFLEFFQGYHNLSWSIRAIKSSPANVRLYFPTLAALIALFRTAQAVVVCSGYNGITGGCERPRTDFHISIYQTINTPDTNCIYNSDKDTGFNLVVCSGPDLSGECTNMDGLPRVDITGDFNWWTPGPGSICRIGN